MSTTGHTSTKKNNRTKGEIMRPKTVKHKYNYHETMIKWNSFSVLQAKSKKNFFFTSNRNYCYRCHGWNRRYVVRCFSVTLFVRCASHSGAVFVLCAKEEKKYTSAKRMFAFFYSCILLTPKEWNDNNALLRYVQHHFKVIKFTECISIRGDQSDLNQAQTNQRNKDKDAWDIDNDKTNVFW